MWGKRGTEGPSGNIEWSKRGEMKEEWKVERKRREKKKGGGEKRKEARGGMNESLTSSGRRC